MIQKRRAKQRKVDQGLPLSRAPAQQGRPAFGTRLIFKEGTAGVVGEWVPGTKGKERPPSPEDQP